MNIEIAKTRHSEVLKADTVNNSNGDFLSTHVQVKKLQISQKYDLSLQEAKKFYNEEDVFSHEIVPTDEHRFVIVKGESGTGKSHLIRWFYAKLMSQHLEDEAILLVRRDDNTLKGTISQLLTMPEVASMPNKEVYERLSKAANTIQDRKLKRLIYNNFIIEVQDDYDEDRTSELTHVTKGNLIALMKNELFEKRMLADGGPIDRIFSKVASTSTVKSSDVKAEFLPEDFEFDIDFNDALDKSDSENKVIRFAKKIGMKQELPGVLANYLNQFTDTVIQRTAGLEPGDFKQIFTEIRKELFRRGKNLTLFIEDVTSFTGVNSALLDELITQHTGMYETENMCRINSIVGVTEYYYKSFFRENHQQRVTKFITVPSNQFEDDNDSLFEFFARYLNTLSLEKSVVDEWAAKGAYSDDYVVHQPDDYQLWDAYEINGKAVNLFPFSKHSIVWLYNNKLSLNRKTPRYIISDIISVYLLEVLYDIKSFPNQELQIRSTEEIAFQTKIFQRNDIEDSEKQRLARFMIVWGDGSDNTYENEGITYIGGVPEEVYQKLGLHVKKGKAIPLPVQESQGHTAIQQQQKKKDVGKHIDSATEKLYAEVMAELTTWNSRADYRLNIGASKSQVAVLTKARDDMITFLQSYIDWASEGISLDLVNKVFKTKNSNFSFLTFERQTRQPKHCAYELPANIDSVLVIDAFIKWRLFGDKKWDFEGGASCLYRVETWAEAIRDQIVRNIMIIGGERSEYYKYAFAANYFQVIFSGACAARNSINNIGAKELLEAPRTLQTLIDDSAHTTPWKQLLTKMYSAEFYSEIRNVVLQYFNIPQGTAVSSKIYELDYTDFQKTAREVIANDLVFDQNKLEREDPIASRANVGKFLLEIQSKVEPVVEAEIVSAKSLLSNIQAHVDTNDIDDDDLDELFDSMKDFYRQAQSSRINISDKTTLISAAKKESRGIISAIESVTEIDDIEKTLDKAIILSRDPIKRLKILSELLETVEKDVNNARQQAQKKMQGFSGNGNDPVKSRYDDELIMIAEMAKEMKGGSELC